MSPFDLVFFRFLLASGGCLAVGLGVWALTALCRRRLPDITAQRSVWILGQITVVAAFLVILLPHSERLRLIPPIELDGATNTHLASPGATAAPATASASGAPLAKAIKHSWLAYVAQAWLMMYLIGLAYAIVRLLHARRVIASLVAAGTRVHALHQHDGFADALARLPVPPVIEVDAPISPMLFGLFTPRLLLPRHLRSFDATQQQMIVEHELTHLRRRDLQWMSVGIALQTLLWFNPFMRLLRENLSWAQELGCDREVLHGRPQLQRKAYAAALLAQLRLQHRPLNSALAFGGVSAGTVAARIALIREVVIVRRGPWARFATFGGLAAIFAASIAFQPAFAWRNDAPSVALFSCTEMIDAASGKRLVHEGQCEQKVTPASTFNIPVSLMGYDSGILLDEHAPALPFKAGYADWQASWRTETDPSSWIKNSVVWYTQQVTARLGAARFQRYVTSFDYGNQDLSGDPGKDNGLSLSWISSTLKISPAEQVAFLRKVVNRELPLSAKAYDMTSRIMNPEVLANGWEIHGKTGTASPVLANGKDDREHEYGWFVGWAQKGQRTIIFARLVQDRRQETVSAGWRVKQAFLRDMTIQLDSL